MMLAEIEARLSGAQTSLKGVESAANFLALQDGGVKRSPMAFILPGSDRADENSLSTGGTRQYISRGFSVMLAFARSDNTGSKGVDSYEQVRAEVMTALIGWQPQSAEQPVTYRSSRVLGVRQKDKIAFFQMDFGTSEFFHAIGVVT